MSVLRDTSRLMRRRFVRRAREVGLPLNRSIAGHAVTSAPSTTATAPSPPARCPGGVFFLAFGRFLLGILALGNGLFLRRFAIFFFDGRRFSDNQTIGMSQSRSSNFHVPKFSVFLFVLEFQKIGYIKKGIAL